MRLSKFMLKHNIITDIRYGFKSNHSTAHALIDANNYISTSLDKGNFTMGIFLDLRKAFDTVDHDILLQKLEYYGVRGVSYDLLRSYLANHSQYVFLKDQY